MKKILLEYVFAIFCLSLLTDLISLVFSVYVDILVCFYTGSERETTHFVIIL